MAEVELRNVAKVFDTRAGAITALDGISLRVEDAQFVAIVGASGCGKSTLLNMIAGFEMPSTGEVLIGGEPVQRPGPDRGVVFQQSALFPWLTVRQNVAFGLELKANRSRNLRSHGVDRLLQRVGLAQFADHYPSQLSGGMRQRAAIASVLAIDPVALLMDEPFGALDALTRSLMQDFLLELLEENRKTVILVTHDITEAVYLSDRVILMAGQPGRVQDDVTIDLPRPRRYALQAEPSFVRLRERITETVRAEVARDPSVTSRGVPS